MNGTIGFIGCGNMGGALARAVAKAVPAEQILLANRTPEKAERLAAELGAQVSDSQTIARTCRYVFLGVKPYMLQELLSSILPALKSQASRPVLVSMAAATPVSKFRDMTNDFSWPVIRIMPSTPVAVGQGITQYCSLNVKEADMADFLTMMAPSGLLDPMPDSQIDAANCLSGCGPAFACLFMEGLADGAVACGLPRDKANVYAAQMLLGTAALALETGLPFGQLKDQVCSPGGVTIQGVRALEKAGLRSAAMEAVIAAVKKTEKMKG